MINLNDAAYEVKDNKIFNNGVAGIVAGCTAKVKRKSPQDSDSAPKYNLILVDPVNQAEINKGYIFANFDQTSDKALTFLVKEMKHLCNVFGIAQLDKVESHEALVTYVMKGINDDGQKTKVNVAVSYGTVDRPKKFLEIASGFAIDTKEPWWNPSYLKVRPVETEIQVGNTGGSSESASSGASGW